MGWRDDILRAEIAREFDACESKTRYDADEALEAKMLKESIAKTIYKADSYAKKRLHREDRAKAKAARLARLIAQEDAIAEAIEVNSRRRGW